MKLNGNISKFVISTVHIAGQVYYIKFVCVVPVVDRAQFLKITVDCSPSSHFQKRIVSNADSHKSLYCRHVFTECDMVIDIPPEYGPTDKYQGTLGHKVNHKFNPTTKYSPIETARLAIDSVLILCLHLKIMFIYL